MKEQQIQKQILDCLKLLGWFAFKINNTGIYKPSTGSYIPAQTKGICDIVALKSGVVLFIECKRPGGKQSENQLYFAEHIRSHNGYYILANSVDDIIVIDKKLF